MPDDKFILVRKPKDYRQTDKRPTVRVSLGTYEKLTAWAAETGISISELVNMAVEYADKHLVYVNN